MPDTMPKPVVSIKLPSPRVLDLAVASMKDVLRVAQNDKEIPEKFKTEIREAVGEMEAFYSEVRKTNV